MITLILIIGLKYWKEKEKQKKKFLYLGIAVITGLVLMIWPIKNLILFGQFTSTSWTGFNLSRGTTVPLQVIKAYQKDGTVPANILSETRKYEREHELEFPSPVSQIEKSTGGRNYNHYIFLIENPDLSRSAIIYRIVNPLHWVKRTLEHYLVWTQPSHHFYLKPAVNPAQDNQLYQFYNQVINRTIFFDLRPGIKSSVLGSIPLPHVFLMDEDLPFTLFGLVIFPLTIVFGGWKVYQYFKTGSIHKGQYLIVIIFITLWVLILPCLTDGFESNRMRFPILPFIIYIIILGLKDIWDKILSYLHDNKPKTNQT
jgi:hypothetical protein